MKKTIKSQCIRGSFGEVEGKNAAREWLFITSNMQELDGIQWNYQADLKAQGNTFSAQYITPPVQGKIID